jgi:hypothetical protein
MADGLLALWGVGVVAAAAGLLVHIRRRAQHAQFVRWLRRRGRDTQAAEGWVRDETYRIGIKGFLVLWSASRVLLIRQRAPEAAWNPTVWWLDLTTLVIYGGLLLWLTHWTWTVSRERRVAQEQAEQAEADMANPTIVEGVRTIQRCPSQPDAERWQGHVTPTHEADDPWREKLWKGPTIERVVDAMNHELGGQPDHRYHITE